MINRRYLEKLYKFDTKSKTYLIEATIDNYDDVYNDLNTSHFKKKDIGDEFNDFILNSSKDIPLSNDISIILYLPVSKLDHKKEATLKAAWRNYYNNAAARMYRQKLSLYKRTLAYFLLSMLLLGTGHFFFNENQDVFHNVLQEGIVIGGWVSMWECFTNILIRKSVLQNSYKLYKRLYNAKIKFEYIK